MKTGNSQTVLLDLLQHAHALELQAQKLLTSFPPDAQYHPPLKARIENHIQLTLVHQQLLENCMEEQEGSVSPAQDIALTAKSPTALRATGDRSARDEVIEGTASIYAFEQFKIAFYVVLLNAASLAGSDRTQRACEQILCGEIIMGDWLRENLPEITESFLILSADGNIPTRH